MYFLKLYVSVYLRTKFHVSVYLRTKFQVSSITLTSFSEIYVKNKLKSETFNDKNTDKQKCFSLSQLRIQTEKF